MEAQYPATSPYVLSVGAIQFDPNETVNLNSSISSVQLPPICNSTLSPFLCAKEGEMEVMSVNTSIFTSGGTYSLLCVGS